MRFLILLPLLLAAAPPTRIPIYPDRPPLATGDSPKDIPTLEPFPLTSEQSSGTAVIVCPGGGYAALMDTYEGADVCNWLNKNNIVAFILRYRVAPYRHPAPLLDVQQAIRLVRSRAKEWHIDPSKIGVMGFSAGGHLAGSAATLFSKKDVNNVSDRPDFAILVYPVISFLPPYGHGGSRDNLLGKTPADPTLVNDLSLETRVTDRTAPCFLVHGRNDSIVDWHNSQLFYDAIKSHGVPADLELLDQGQHGFGTKNPDPKAEPWTDRALKFLRTINVLAPVKLEKHPL